MKLSRRQFLHRATLGSAFTLLPPPLLAKGRPNLSIPPLIEVGRGRPVRLDFHPAQTQFEAGKWADVWGANGQYLAPTVKVKSGDFVKLTYANSLPQVLSINIQGLLAPTAMIGSNHRQLKPNSSWSPIVNIQQAACTCWYHADTMLNSAPQLYRGIAGLWIIDDEASKQAKLPNKYGINDIPLILQDQLLDKNGKPVFSANAPFLAKRLFVNGKENPKVTLPRGWVRLRLVNASVSRHYALQLDNGKPLYVIATGIGMLAEPLEMSVVMLAPSERVELLVDLNEGERVALLTGEKRSILHTVGQFFQDSHELVDNVVLEMQPEGLPSALNMEPQLPEFDLSAFNLKIAQERKFELRVQDALINRQRFDPKRIDAEVKLGSVERWYILATETIGFTLQGAKFVLETRNRKPQPHKQLAWRDTVRIEKDEEVTLLVKFEKMAEAHLPFTFGASDFSLRDKGLMGQFIVK